MTNTEFIARLTDAATNYKTLYVMGCFGAPMTAANKKRYASEYSYNRAAARTKMINAASDDVFGFDCVCLIKGILWGWNGDKTKSYGGATYSSNGVPDIGADSMIDVCSEVSSDFSRIAPGEAVWVPGHIGVYIGDGLAVECTPAWANKVQITACNRTVPGYNRRDWKKHGKLPYIEYAGSEAPAVKDTGRAPAPFTVLEWQKAAIADGFSFPKYGADGEWGAECRSVAKKAICKKRTYYAYRNLTVLVQRAVGVSEDGLFGPDTRAAVIRYQRDNGLEADGEVGINTWTKILGV